MHPPTHLRTYGQAFTLYGGEGEALADVVLSIRAVETMRQLLSGKSKAQEQEDKRGGGAARSGGARARGLGEDGRLEASATSKSRDFDRELDEAREAGRAEGRQLDEARQEGRSERGSTAQLRDGPRSTAEASMEGAGGYAAARSVADQLSSLPPPHSSSDMNRAEKAALWSASERLEARAARAGRTAPPVAEEEWHVDTVHNVLLQFVSYAPTAGEPPPSAAFLTFQFFHFEPRTTPKALLEPPLSDGYRPAPGGSGGSGGAQATLEGQQRAAAQGGGAVRGRQDALRLDVGLLTLGSGVLRDSQVADP